MIDVYTTSADGPEPGPGQYLVITRGLPASGKSTWARKFRDRDNENRIIVEKDQLRDMLGGGYVKKNEYAVHTSSVDLTRKYLGVGKTVIVSDTNLPNRTVKEYFKVAFELGVDVWVVDFTDVPLDECLRRNNIRAASYEIVPHPDDKDVPSEVITDMHQRFIRGREWPLALPELDSLGSGEWDAYKPRLGHPLAVLVDIDGTLALMNGRSPYDWNRVFEDSQNESVVEHVRDLVANPSMPTSVILMSGRDSAAREETERWLEFHEIPYDELHMRAAGDVRRDDIVKYELFNQHVRDRFRVRYVLDDRDQVVSMWRAMGLSCWQVNYGSF